ncbi:MAG: amino acid permease [bacterium]|nr:amino acid permease [bacterium]
MESGHLQRRLGLISATSITVGAVIGSGIFLKPLIVSQSLPAIGWIFALWIGLGVICLFGAFAYGELGSMFPQAGGQYAFLREAWGRGVGFTYGWVFFWVINSGTVAALAVAFAEYLLPGVNRLLGLGLTPGQLSSPYVITAVATVMILFLAVVNHVGVIFGALLQNVSTLAKVGALGTLIVGGAMLVFGDDPAALAARVPDPSTFTPAADAQASLTQAGLVTAFIGIFWAYEGWYQMPFNAAEIKRPERNVPRGLILGMVILVVVYAAMNWIYLEMVPFAEMRSLQEGEDQQVAYRTVARIFSPEVADYLTVAVAISVMGAANPNFLSSPRAFYAMAKDGMVPRALSRVSPKWKTPVVSIWVQAIWAVGLVLYLQKFHDITSFVVFAGFLFYAMTVAGVYRLRFLRPDAERPYRCTGYPVTPALFILVSVAFVVALLLDEAEQMNALYGLAILATGVLYYWGWHIGHRTGREGADISEGDTAATAMAPVTEPALEVEDEAAAADPAESAEGDPPDRPAGG